MCVKAKDRILTLLSNKNILIGITGGIAAYKICELIRLFKKNGANVKVTATPNALEFVTELTLDTLSQEQVLTEKIYYEQFNTDEKKPEHIALCDWADVFLIAPASANTIGKIANGLCDNLLTSLACAFQKQMFLAPAMNTGMYNNKAVQKNIETLKSQGKKIIAPESGFLACGTNGVGRLAEVNSIFEAVKNYFEKDNYLYLNAYLKGKKVVITAGGTKENIDPVRYIGNYSSGKMGTAIADRALEAGAVVTLIKTFELGKRSYKTIDVTSARDMLDAVKEEFLNKDADILIMTAAVADYRPETTANLKIKKENNDEMTIKLIKNPDILKEMCKAKKQNQQIIGFCAESNDLIENAKTKIKNKGCDFLIANDISRKDTGFSSNFNEVYILDKDLKITKLEKDTKENIALQILELLYGKNQ